MLGRFPEVLDEDVIVPAPLLYADRKATLLKRADEGRTGKLATMVGVHDFRDAIFHDDFFQHIDAGGGGQAVRPEPSQPPTGGLVEDGTQINEAGAYRDVGRVHGPDLIWAVDAEIA